MRRIDRSRNSNVSRLLISLQAFLIIGMSSFLALRSSTPQWTNGLHQRWLGTRSPSGKGLDRLLIWLDGVRATMRAPHRSEYVRHSLYCIALNGKICISDLPQVHQSKVMSMSMTMTGTEELFVTLMSATYSAPNAAAVSYWKLF